MPHRTRIIFDIEYIGGSGFGDALSFNGVNQGSIHSSRPSFTLAQDFTVEVRFKKTTDDYQVIASNFAGAAGWYLAKNASDYIEFTFEDGTNTVTVTSSDQITEDWVMVSAIYDRDWETITW